MQGFFSYLYFSGSPFTLHDLEFNEIPVKTFTSSGREYSRWIRVGMPKVPDDSRETVFYLYKSKEDAESGNNTGGTGFYVGIPSQKHPNGIYIYGISNWHAAIEGGYSVIRVNSKDGGTETFDFDSTEWDFIPLGGDVAISPILPINEQHSLSYVHIESFATDKIVDDLEINVGDDIFMMGRFANHDGGNVNLPAARFGHISVMPTHIPQEKNNNRQGRSYIVDMHSRPGYSGSPVYVYRNPGTDLHAANSQAPFWNPPFLYLLGIHWGQFREPWEDDKGRIVTGFSGMSCIVPAERILALVNKPNLISRREKIDAEQEKYYRKNGYPPIPD